MKIILTTTILMLSAVAAAPVVYAQHHQPDDSAMADCPAMKNSSAGVDERGDKAMGFSHEKTTHHFILTADGGAIEVVANDVDDQESRKQIRGHLNHISKLFGQGNFQIPMLVHDRMPDGAEVMKQQKANISYSYEDTANGGRVRIRTANPKALSAVHQFLRFQIAEHHTGDSAEITSSPNA
jgi:hypothetical protein